jgi:non-heme Fe2+,alpha-ketoglutarate-dependent halogenase
MLSDADVAQFRERGILHPIDVLSPGELAAARDALARIEAAPAAIRRSLFAHKSHLVSRTLNDLVRHPVILDCVARLIGPDLLVWGSDFFVKEGGSPNFVSWHQDAAYWGLTPDDIVTAWVALTPSTVESGCLEVVPGTHRGPIVAHDNTFAADNMLSRGQTIEHRIDRDRAIHVVLAPGQMSLHHVKIAHASGPNRSAGRRAGFAIRYIGAHVRQERDVPDSATLVRGTSSGRFALEPVPAGELDPEAVAYHQETWRLEQQIIAATS